jgi:ion channel-forming bestrophin family protein
MLFVWRGSLLRQIASQQLFTFGLACVVVWAHGTVLHWKVPLTPGPFSLMGVSLALFLGFRINASYDRYWEARKLWGQVLVDTRNLTRQALTLTHPGTEVAPFVRGLMAFTAAMRDQLRELPVVPALAKLAPLLPPAVMARLTAGVRGTPVIIGLWLGEQMQAWREQGRLQPELAVRMEMTLDQLLGALGGCERIASTPLPFTYRVILHRSVYVYCMMLPFGLVDPIGWVTPLVVAFVSYTFFALEALSDEIEQPFGTMPNDLALDAMVTTITSSLHELLGEPPLPLPQPDSRFLLS